ncbi:MAG: glycosyltransferase [Marinilabiliaceae bacterium]|nr:glycosyltransferase [Marinilabiliaceae bacterium]
MIINLNPAITLYVIVGFFVLFSYIVLIMFAIKGIIRLSLTAEPNYSNDKPFISVVVAFRNEASNLNNLCNYLLNQNYPVNKYEIILVDDYSTDNWRDIFDSKSERLMVISSFREGKKAALREGILHAKGDIIVTTDADCILQKNWLNVISSSMLVNSFQMLIGPVKMESENNFFGRFQVIDFLSLQLVGLGLAKCNFPIMCNGANISYMRSGYIKYNDQLNDKFLSGDDQFLLHSFKKSGFSIGAIISDTSLVCTKVEKGIKSLLKQRIRWASKSTGYTDWQTIIVALLVFWVNLFWVSFSVLMFFNTILWPFFVLFVLLKAFVDRSLLKPGSQLFQIRWDEFLFWIMQLLHPFFICIVVFSSFIVPVSWKGRQIIKG